MSETTSLNQSTTNLKGHKQIGPVVAGFFVFGNGDGTVELITLPEKDERRPRTLDPNEVIQLCVALLTATNEKD